MALVVILAGTVLAAPSGAANAAPEGCTPHGSAAGKKVNTSSLIRELQSLEAAGKTHDQADYVLANEWCVVKISRNVTSGANKSTPTEDPSAVTAKGGSANAEVSPSYTNGGADVSDTAFYYDEIYYNSPTGTYFAASEWHWKNHDWASDSSAFVNCAGSRAIGGKDGAAIRLSNGPMQVYGWTIYVGGDPGMDSNAGDYSDYKQLSVDGGGDEYGQGFNWTDNSKGTFYNGIACDTSTGGQDYDTYKGWLAFEFRHLDHECRNSQVFSQYTHTWSSTSVTGFDISASSFGIQWSNAGSSFTLPSSGQTANVC